MGSFSDRIAVVTGATGGIGRETAKLLSSRGAKVVLTGRNRAKLEAIAADIDGPVTKIAADLKHRDAAEEVVKKALDTYGRLDIIANTAGDYTKTSIEEITDDVWQDMLDANTKVTFEIMRAAVPPMRRQGGGKIVNVSSVDACIPKPTMVDYAAAKAAVVSLTMSFAAKYAKDDILVNCVAPGPVATERAKAQPWFEERLKQSPLGRLAEPLDIAEVIAFLASDINRSITGETIIASCGLFRLTV
jgi:3-oxoacyl-[acyl-carrier protein] reductase